jgi:hypothetical protein
MDRTQQNKRNRDFGKAVERQVAKIVGGERTPGSGAFKFSNRNLTGDVQVNDALGRGLCKIECKGTSIISAKGGKTFTLRKSVLQQAMKEADDQGEIGVVWIHFLNDQYDEDFVAFMDDKGDAFIVRSRHFVRLLNLAKLGAVVEEKGVYP